VGRGLQPLPEIIRGCELPGSQVKQALLLLIQHNFISAYTHKDDENARNAKPPVVLYEANVDTVLQILRCVCMQRCCQGRGRCQAVCLINYELMRMVSELAVWQEPWLLLHHVCARGINEAQALHHAAGGLASCSTCERNRGHVLSRLGS